IVEKRGTALALSQSAEIELRSAGATPNLLATLSRLKAMHADRGSCPASLTKAAALAHQKQYEQAEQIVRALLENDPRNGGLHFALGHLKQQQGDWDGAFDEYSNSKEVEPNFPEVHNRLSLVFYRGDDGDNAI